MKITYDPSIDAAYIYFTPIIMPGQVSMTYTCDPIKVNGQINLDFDEFGFLLSIEVLDASRKLPKILLETADIVT